AQNDRVWAINRQEADKKGGVKQIHQFPTKIMVWLGACGKGLTTLVAAGAIAERWLSETYGIEIVAYVSGIGHIEMPTETEVLLKQSSLQKPQID
ncbi:unnamed protein product, partial [Didymodactylos carnosus]